MTQRPCLPAFVSNQEAADQSSWVLWRKLCRNKTPELRALRILPWTSQEFPRSLCHGQTVSLFPIALRRTLLWLMGRTQGGFGTCSRLRANLPLGIQPFSWRPTLWLETWCTILKSPDISYELGQKTNAGQVHGIPVEVIFETYAPTNVHLPYLTNTITLTGT